MRDDTANELRSISGEAPRLSLREEQKRRTEYRLLAAASEVFAEKGYYAATIDDIVGRAGASRGTYYLYFKTKAEVLHRLIIDFNDEARDVIERLGSLKAPTKPEVEEWIAQFVQLYEEHRQMIRAWWQAMQGESVLQDETNRNFDAFLAVLATHLARAEGRHDGDPAILSLLLLSQLERVCYLLFVRRWPIDRAAVERTLTDLWWRSIANGDST